MNTILKIPAAYNIDATAFQHIGTFYILWLLIKMDVSTALQLILSKMVNPCLTTSPRIQGTHLFLFEMTEEVKEHLQL
jgi:GH43 family beta-xylosidase